jgi:hypothetical protein
MRDEGTIGPTKSPAFYLCACGFIGHVGVGPVLGSEQGPGPLCERCNMNPSRICDVRRGEQIVVDTIG